MPIHSSRRARVLAGVASVLIGAAGAARAQGTDTDYESNILPTPSLYGGIGLLEMRNARFMPDGYLALSVDIKSPDDRIALTFQPVPWLEATFRYAINYALAPLGQRALYDRSFDWKIRLWEEGLYVPQVAVGLQDFLGTGVYSAEYAVASKRFGPVDISAGMGWGRLASRPTLENPFCAVITSFCTRPGDINDTGGTPLFGNYLHGPNVGIFGGFEYETPVPNLTFKAEYSTDDYKEESSYTHNPSIHPKNYAPVPVNAGFSYRMWNNLDLGVAVIGGRELSLNANISMNPAEPNWPYRLDPQPPFVARPPDARQPLTQLHLDGPASNGAAVASMNYIDLSAISAPDKRPPDPSLFHENEWHVADGLQRAGLRVTDGWLSGDTLVAQINVTASRPPSCAALTSNGNLAVPEIVIVGKDWNPLLVCSSRVASNGQAAGPAATWTPDTLGRMTRAIEDQQVVVEGISIAHAVVKVEIENDRYFRDAEAVSRTARALSAAAPANIEAFEITTTMAHMPLTTVTISRSEIDAVAQGDATPAETWSSTILSDASTDTNYENGASDPQFSWSVFPSLQSQLFDPNNPAYIGIGISGSTRLELLHGLVLDDQGTVEVWNNFGSITRSSNSALPHVRTDIVSYLQKGSTGINDLTLSYYTKPAPELYARLTAGYIEQMFAGVGGEILYRPFGQRWALGADIYDVYQRSFDDLFGLQTFCDLATNNRCTSDNSSYNTITGHYHVVTGHVSLYVETPWEDIVSVLRAGRYLAGDKGATLELYKRFDTGVIVGAWMTFTNVPFSQFGEGSFDKGIRIVIPTEWALPFGSSTKFEEDLRPIQRDGGQPLNNDAELYDMTQPSSYGDMERQWSDVFE